MVKILFVCLGNICRSPAAEGVLKSLLLHHGLQDRVYCESAGTSGHYHAGELPDSRMRAKAKLRGVELDSLARQFTVEDFTKFDFIITMDRSNFTNVLRLDPTGQFSKKVIPMGTLCIKLNVNDVPDPYYGGERGFDEVLDIVEDGCRGLLDRLDLLKYELD